MSSTPDMHRTSTRTGAALLAATRPLGRIALSCGLAGALGVGVASAAVAGGQPDKPGHASASGKPAARGGDAERGAPHPAAERGSTQRSQDPAGNNGTIKVDGAAWDARVDNEPHTSCAFRVTFFGFDEGQTADITVTGIAPTGGGALLHETAVPNSDDRAGGAAQDFDGATRVYTAEDLGLDAVTPHPQQGYHLKVAVDSLEAPGGAKQKVLWLEPCEDRAPVTQAEPQPEPRPETGEFREGGARSSVPATGSKAEVPEQPEEAATSPEARPSEVSLAAPAVAAYREVSAPAADRATSATALRPTQQASALPVGLAFTGAGGLGLMALLGAGATAAGAGLQVARRRAGSHAG